MRAVERIAGFDYFLPSDYTSARAPQTPPHVRVEACDSCNISIKSVDLTKNGLAVPVVELATVSLNLWAERQGYSKLQLNLLGM